VGALLEMESSYENRVLLMQHDTFHWNALRARAELIDWGLLILHVALIRRRHNKILDEVPPPGPASQFIRSLADEIERRREEGEDAGAGELEINK
jgi:hypothetical protein